MQITVLNLSSHGQFSLAVPKSNFDRLHRSVKLSASQFEEINFIHCKLNDFFAAQSL